MLVCECVNFEALQGMILIQTCSSIELAYSFIVQLCYVARQFEFSCVSLQAFSRSIECGGGVI